MSEDKFPVSGIACDLQGTITEFGKAAEELFGYTRDELVGKGNVGMFHIEANLQTLVPLLLKTASEKGEWEDVVELVRKDGSHFKGRLNVKPLMQDDQQIGFMGKTEFIENI